MCATTERLLRADGAATLYGTDAEFMEYDAGGATASDVGGNDEDSGGTTTTSVTVGMAWLLLVLAILLEVAGTTSMKLSEGFTRLVPSILIYVLYALSFTVFPFALQAIELSTAYAVWSGLGTTVTAVIGFVYFQDTVNKTKIVALAAIICGCVVLNFADEIEEEVKEKDGENNESFVDTGANDLASGGHA